MDGKSIRNKLIGSDDQRAVSPVIGVILMVAITVILAAVIAAFVLDLGQGQSANPQAGLSFDHNPNSDNTNGYVNITVNSVERADSLSVDCGSNDVDSLTAEAGGSLSVDLDKNSCNSNSIQVIGSYDGSEAVVADYDDHL
ncbi:type IV pilin [Natrinema thermotolerans]